MELDNVMTEKLTWILAVAKRILPHFQASSDALLKFILTVLQKNNVVIAHNNIACDGNIFMIIAQDPKKVIQNVMTEIKNANSEDFQTTVNPVNVITKLVDNEFMVTMDTTHMMYLIKATVPSNYLLKAIACKCIASVKNYYKYVEDNAMVNIDELHPDFNYTQQAIKEIVGGRKKDKQAKRTKRSPRIDILTKLMKHISEDKDLASGIVFVNDLHECNAAAMNIIYKDRKYKDVIVNYMNAMFVSDIKYKFKAFLHNDFSVPYNFIMTKHSCLVNDNNASQVIYIANLYNIGSYMPVPCYSSSENIYMSHPLIKLQLLYIDLYMIEHKTGNSSSAYHSKLLSTYNELISFKQEIKWIGYYTDDAQNRIKYNMMSKVRNINEQYYV